jgi:hypothetical protein
MMPPSHDRPLPDFCASGEAHLVFPSGTRGYGFACLLTRDKDSKLKRRA